MNIDRAAFDRLTTDARPRLAATIRRLVGHPDDTDELIQQTLLKAWERRDSFRGDSGFATWLCAIGGNLALDHLRAAKRWRTRAQVAYANECRRDEDLAAEVGQVFATPDFTYDVNEHIAYCFACVGRSLNPEEYAAVVLREIMGLSNREAARCLGVSESVLRHRLAAGRGVMTDAFEGLCSLVNKQGVCYQCKGLRELAGEHRRGPLPPEALDLDSRLALVAQARDDGRTKALHDLFWRRTAAIERQGTGHTDAQDCGKP